MRRPLLWLTLFCLSASGRVPDVTIRNRSGIALEQVVVSGSGFLIPVCPLAVDEARSVAPKPHGESGIRVTFNAGGQHYDSGEQGYFEGGNAYRVSISVDSGMKVRVDSHLK